MINDPLLSSAQRTDDPSPWAPPSPGTAVAGNASTVGSTTSRAPRSSATRTTRRRHPALSSRILAAGLSTSAMFALTAGYASAERKVSPQPATGAPATQGNPNNAVNGSTNSAQTNGNAPGQAGVNSQGVPAQASPRVVQVPVAPIAPATPATQGSGGSATQQSSGSH